MAERTNTNQKQILSNSALYVFNGLLIKCFSFFLLPLYTEFLATEEYGITGLASQFLSTMSYVAAFSLYSAVMRFYVDLRESKIKLKRFYGTVVIFTFVSSIALGLVLTTIKPLVSKYFFSGIPFYPNILLCLISLVFQCQHTIFENILRGQQKAIHYTVLSIVYSIMTVALTILFVVRCRMGASGVILATLIAGFVYSIYFMVFMIRNKEIVFCIDLGLLKEALEYSIPLMPHDLSTQIAGMLSMALIGNSTSLSNLGIYTIASQFGNIADTIQSYVNQAYCPWLYEKLKTKNENFKNDIRSVSQLLASIIGLLLLGIALFSREYIVLFVSSEYKYAWRFIPLIVLVYTIKITYYFYVSVLLYYKEASRFIFIATLSSSFINILLSFILVPIHGTYGSILADGISMLLRVLIVVTLSLKFEDIGLRIKDFLFNFFYISIFIFIGTTPAFKNNLDSFNFSILLHEIMIVLTYTAFVLLLNRKQIERLVKQRQT